MAVEIRQVGPESLPRYGEIPIAFEVASVFRIDPVDGGLGGIRLREEKIAPTYVKDYDTLGDENPEGWPRHFEMRDWGIFLASDGPRLAGGAVVVCDAPDVQMLDGRRDLAVLWDIRVHPNFRGRGVGADLFRSAVGWARKRGCRQLKAETQNVNVPACRFYASQGCCLGEIHRHKYVGHPEVAHEVMLVWYLDL
jgi:GNAT superfamily N-acetyltransferase